MSVTGPMPNFERHSYTVRPLREDEYDQWEALYAEHGIFATESPDYVRAVARALPAGCTLVPWAITKTDKETRLVAVAPMVADDTDTRWGRKWELLGITHLLWVHDYPAVTVSAREERNVMRELVGAAASLRDSWQTFAFTTTPDGWIDGHWADDVDLVGYDSRVHLCSVVDPAKYREGISRNLKESIRRGKNRMNKKYGEGNWQILRHDAGTVPLEEWAGAVQLLADLNIARSESERGQEHKAYFGGAEGLRLTKALKEHPDARLRCYELVTPEGRGTAHPSAALITMSGPHGDQMLFTGMNDASWDYSPMPQLIARAIEDAAAEGKPAFILPSGVDEAKLRWGGKISVYPDFTLEGLDRRAKVRKYSKLGLEIGSKVGAKGLAAGKQAAAKVRERAGR